MKKFLLTLLGASLLCGLSPHPLSAQTDHSAKTFTITLNSNAYSNGLILAGKRVKAALPNSDESTNKTDLTIDETDPVEELKGVPDANRSYGFGQIQFKQTGNDDVLTLDFDFSKCPTDGTSPVTGTNRLSSFGTNGYLQLGPTGFNEPSLAVRLSMGENKVIKKVVFTFCTNAFALTTISKTEKFEDFLTTTQSFGSTEKADGFTITNSPTTASSASMSLTSATYEASALHGSKEPFNLQMLKSTQTSIYISTIEVTYYDNTDNWVPKDESSLKFGKAYGDPIYYRTSEDNTTYSEWHNATGAQEIRLTDKYIQTKIGHAITTFIRPTSFPLTRPTVIIDPSKYYIGALTSSDGGVSFYTLPDDELVKSVDLKNFYSLEYYLDNYTGYTGAKNLSAYYANGNITPPSTVTVAATSGNLITKISDTDQLTADNSIYALKTTGIYDIFKSSSTPISNLSATTTSSFATDAIKLFYTYNGDPIPQSPMAPVVTIPSAIVSAKTGVYSIFDAISVTANLNSACIYPDAKIYYIKGDKELYGDDFDKTKATELKEGVITIDDNCVLSLRTYAIVDGIEISSGVINRTFEKIEGVNISNASQLNKSNKGKLVSIDFPLQTLTSGYLSSDPKTLNIYCRDTLENAVRLVTRFTNDIHSDPTEANEALANRTTPGEAFRGIGSTTHDNMPFIPAGGVVGILEFDEKDHPVVVLKDENKNIDNFEFCYSESKKKYSDVKHDDNFHFIRNTFIGNRRDKISEEDYGKYICIYAHFNQIAQTFTPIDGTDPLKLSGTAQFTPSPVANSYGTPTLPSADGDYSVVGIVEYDAASQSYYIIPRAYTPIPVRPELTVVNTNKGTQVVGEQIENEAKDGKTAIIKMLNNKFQISYKNGTNAQKCYYEFFDGEQFTANSFPIASVKPALNIKSFDDEKKVVVTAYLQNCSHTDAPYAASEPYFLTVKDVVSTAPVFHSITEVKEELKDKEVAELTGKYYKVDANMVVLGFDETSKYMYLRDIDSDGFIVVLSKNVWSNYPFVLQIEKTHTLINHYHKPRIGDRITEITFTPVSINGMVVADLSGLEGQYIQGTKQKPNVYQWGYIRGHAFSTSDWENDPDHTQWGDLKFGEPMYKNHMDRLGAPIDKNLCYDASNENDAAKLTFDDTNIADYVAINNVKLTATEDAEPAFSTTGLGTNLEIDWSLLPAAESTAALAEENDATEEPAAKDVKAEIIKAYNDAKTEGKDIYFNIRGYIFKNADASAYALKIKDYSITEAAPLPKVAVKAAGKDVEPTPEADDASKLTASFVKTVSVSSPDAEDEKADYEILMSINGGEFEAYDAAKLAGFDTHNTTVAFKCPLRPGYLPGDRITTITLNKEASDVNTLAEMTQGDNANNLYHFRKHLKVVAAAEGTVMTADKEGNLTVVAAAPAKAAEGKYLTDIVLVRNSKNTASIHEIDADAELLDEDDSYAISTPATTTLFGATIAEGNATDAEGKVYTIDPTFAAIPQGDAEAWSLTGYILPGADDKQVIYLTASKAIARVALPVITPAEAAFLDQTTFTIDCATTGATIEYSLDGGKTWLPYNGDAVKIEATCEILARATAAEMLPSHEAKASVVREYLSGNVTITVDEQEAVTTITISGPEGAAIYYSLDGAAEKLYEKEKPIVITNDTQAEIRGTIKAYALESGKRPGNNAVKDYKVSFKKDVTGIGGVGADEAESVSVEGNTIIVPEGAQTFDIAGRRVNPQGLPRGIYIVRLASGKAVKAVVK